MDLYLGSVLLFVLVLAALIIKNRDKIEIRNYVLFVRRTDKGRDLISRISSLSEKFWSKLGVVSTVVSFGGMAFAFYYIANIFLKQITGAPTPSGGPRLVIPVPSQKAALLPGVIGVPFWSWIISIGLLMVVHEGMHGVMVKTVKSKIESLGVLLLVVIPGAFVEPDEENLGEKGWLDQLKVYSAGSFGNFCLAAITFLVFSFAFIPVFTTPAVGFAGYVNATKYNVSTYPAQKVNLTSPILSVNDHRIRNVDELSEVLEDKRPGEGLRIGSLHKNYTITLAEDPENKTQGFIGIAGISETHILKRRYRTSSLSGVFSFMQNLLGWIFVLNLGIGIMNLLPLKPLDGGLMLEAVMENFYPEKSERVIRIVSSISLFVLVSIFFMIFLG